MTGDAHEFAPDWTLPPADHLAEWMAARRLSPPKLALVAQGARGSGLEGLRFIMDVLRRGELRAEHARVLAAATEISAEMWLALEAHYREDLAAGRRDTGEADYVRVVCEAAGEPVPAGLA